MTPGVGSVSVMNQKGIHMDQTHQNWHARYKVDNARSNIRTRAGRTSKRRQLYISPNPDAMVLQQFKSYENLRKSQNATASNAYFNNRSSLNSQLNINLASS